MKLTVIKKLIGESMIIVITSLTEEGNHYLFLEWDDGPSKNIIKALCVLGIDGILIKTPRGHHFISSMPPMKLSNTIVLQRLFEADPEWVKHNRKVRKKSILRVSMKYEQEAPLFVVPYPRTDEKLKEHYEEIIDEYFHQGDPYFADSRKGEEAIDWRPTEDYYTTEEAHECIPL